MIGAGLASVPAAGALSGYPDWLVIGIGGGLAGPAIARITFATVGKGSDERPIGVATLYEPLRDAIEEQIDVIGADEQSAWINDEVLPRIKAKGESPKYVGDRLKDYIKGLSEKRLAAKAAEIDWIDETVADSSVSDDERREALVRRAIEVYRAYRTVDRLLE